MKRKKGQETATRKGRPAVQRRDGDRIGRLFLFGGLALMVAAVMYALDVHTLVLPDAAEDRDGTEQQFQYQPTEKWLQRAYAIDKLFHKVYTAGWEGANGAIGDAYMFAVTGDSALLHYHSVTHDMLRLFNGTWVDDRAWAALAEMYWWNFTGRTNNVWVEDARQRYMSARTEGRLSNHEGFWSWYNWPQNAKVNDQVFTNSNMNHMVSVACWLYEATGEPLFLEDALKVWNGDGTLPGIEKIFYRGAGQWKGEGGLAAFGKQLPWEGTAYCSVAASLYRVTGEKKYRDIAVATAKRIMDPANNWVHPQHYYQLRMDGNGAFVHYLLDAYEIAPEELSDLPDKIEKMLDHVWTNGHGKATVVLHRDFDHGIRNGWNPHGGEDGYGVNEVGTVHPQSQAVRAFGVFSYFKYRND